MILSTVTFEGLAQPKDLGYPIKLKSEEFHHVSFGSISPTKYEFNDKYLIAKVNESSSIMMYPLRDIIEVKGVRFQWMKQGTHKD